MRKCPLRTPADLARDTLLHAATLREAWPRWLAAANISDLKPARDQVHEHFYFTIQAAIEGLGVVMGPVALVTDELRTEGLLAPLNGSSSASSALFGGKMKNIKSRRWLAITLTLRIQGSSASRNC
jgi:DNA-binding transcriptional LysR family regulator